MIASASIEDYIMQFPPLVQERLQLVRETIKKIIPAAIEKISYGIPTFVLGGNLIHYGGFKNHIGLYPGAQAVKDFAAKIVLFKTAKGSIQFPHDQPLPLSLIKEITRWKIKLQRK